MKRTGKLPLVLWWMCVLFGIGILFFSPMAKGTLPVPTDDLVGLYHPWRDEYATLYPRGIPYKNFLITDPIRQQIPWRKIAIDSWKSGQIPLWNPYNFSGTSLAGNIQAAAFYPFNVIFFLFSFPTAWTVLIVMQLFLAMFFTYWYLVNKNIRPAAAAVGALSFSFSGFSVSWFTWGTMVQTALWIPFILLSVDKLLSGARRWWFGLVFGLICLVFAGHMQIAFYSYFLIVVYMLSRVGAIFEKKYILRDVLSALVVSALVTAVQWFPFLSEVFQSARFEEVQATIPGYFIPWMHGIGFVVPDFFGNPATLNYWGVWNWAEFAGYIGIVPLLFAVHAVWYQRKKPSGWVMLLVAALFFAFPTIIAQIPYKIRIPFLSSLQPTRLLVIIDFCLAVLASIGADILIRGKAKMSLVIPVGCIALMTALYIGVPLWVPNESVLVAKRNMILPGIFVFFFLCTTIVWRAKKGIQGVLFLIFFLITVFDLLRFAWKFTPFTPREYFFPETNVTTFLRGQKKPFRVLSTDNRISPPNVFSYYGIETIEGYDPIYNADYETFFAALSRGSSNVKKPFGFNRILTTSNIDSPLLPYLNVQYVLALDDIERSFLKKIMQDGQTRVYEYLKAKPRVQLVDRYEVLSNASESEIIAKMMENSMTGVAIVARPIEVLSLPLTSEETVDVSFYNQNHMRLKVKTANPRLLVVRNIFDQGWNVFIDSKHAEVVPVDYIFLGVVVPSGDHTVDISHK